MLSFRLLLLRAVLPAVFLVFLGRLAYLQLLQGGELRDASERNHLRWVRSPAPRGVILDRTGRILATSTPGLTAWLVSGEVPARGWDTLINRLVALGIFSDRPTARRQLANAHRYPSFNTPVRLKRALTITEVSRLEEHQAFLPGVYLKEEPQRLYPEGALAAHALGYLREINADELAQREEDGFRPGDRIGRAGIERVYEDALRGTEGGEQIEVDAYGRKLRTLQRVQPRPGTPVTLTLDLAVQRAAETAFAGKHGAAVALDPRTGEILALASLPAYDLNAMTGRLTPTMLAEMRSVRAEVNRATQGTYPPGSVYKIVTAAAALERNKVPANAYYYCDGVYHGIHCWQSNGHGALNLSQAIAHSCNVAFMKLAEQVGIDALANTGRQFGFGQKTGVAVLPEAAGLVPDPQWAKRAGRGSWQLGETLQVGIGQSALEVTPLQAARLIAAIANGGSLVHPQLVKSVGDTPVEPQPAELMQLKPATLRRITNGLRAAVSEGTAKQLDAELQIAGKTGTAQNPRGEDHAWFVGFAPADHPTVAVAVIVEHGGHGGTIAAPIAEAIIRQALGKTDSSPSNH